MAEVKIPNGYTSWNAYIDAQVAALSNPTLEDIRLLKRDIKLGQIATLSRQGRYQESDDADPNAIAYRLFNQYSSPGTFSPEEGHPMITTPPYGVGLYRYVYNGYFNDDVTWFDTHTPTSSGPDSSFTIPSGNDKSVQWLGYFQAPDTGTYTFTLRSDDAAYVWIGNAATEGYTVGNAFIADGGLHGDATPFSNSINMTANHYYPMRIQWGNHQGGAGITFTYTYTP